MKKIKLTQGEYAFVDDKDFEYLNQWKWHYCQYGKTGYAKRRQWDRQTQKARIVRMHHFIVPLEKGFMIDHINGNGIDNRRQNLRLVTKSQNMMNSGKRKSNTSGQSGVSWHKKANKWRAYIVANKKQYHLGLFVDKKDAISAYKEGVKKYHKEYAFLIK